MTERMVRVPAATLRTFAELAFAAAGVPTRDASTIADALVDADLRGVHSHGTRWVPSYVEQLRRGGTNPRPDVRVVEDGGTTAVVDGDLGLGHVVASAANDLAIERALAGGVGAVALARSTHCGAMAYYTNRAAARGCVGFAVTNGNANMAPTGGTSRLVGNNPLAYSFPTRRGFTFALDMATSVVAGSRLLMAIERGEKIPPGWALDRDGRPTEDPRDWRERDGLLVPIGGPKGYGLALVIEILSGVLSGGHFGPRRGQPGSVGTSQFFLAIRIDRFMPLEAFLDRMDTLIEQIKSSELAPGSPGVFLPGEIEQNNKNDRLTNGIPLDDTTIDALGALALELGLPRPGGKE
ncbi:MAG TPA: Ldh family oxidoreductase [Chloroflexota bacterium]